MLEAVEVRPARPTDADALAVVYMESAELHYRLDPSVYTRPEIDMVEKRYRDRLSDLADAQILVAQYGLDIIGYIELQIRRPDGRARMLRDLVAAEVDMAVLDEYRGRGIGSLLLRSGEEWAVAHGAELMVLNTHAANVDAIRFYQERQGYRTAGLFLTKRPDRAER
ncbi:MAG TPA: GNAT family N-acetyltransferase [Candidatus Dormibacteraeota bacterium]|jgi:ribosomal protein S18 acetylase RimI-like enzyme|nr:GNAT family N-acetyltransferase [Candidatus Dormibacteraeota bacterium]